jgi:hypothetical protein
LQAPNGALLLTVAREGTRDAVWEASFQNPNDMKSRMAALAERIAAEVGGLQGVEDDLQRSRPSPPVSREDRGGAEH